MVTGTTESDFTAERLAERYLREVCLGGRLDLIGELAHEEMLDEANRAFRGPPGRAGLVAHVKGFRRAIADLRIEIARIAAGRDASGAEEVMACWRFEGRQVAPWLGRAADGAAISGDVVSIFTLREGRMARYRLWLCARLPEGAVVFDSSRALAAREAG